MFNPKEEGYDEFVAECVRKGREDVAQGRFCTAEELRTFATQVIERKAREIEEFERQEMLNYA